VEQAHIEGVSHDQLEVAPRDRDIIRLGDRFRAGRNYATNRSPRRGRSARAVAPSWMGWNPLAWLGLGAGVVAGAIIADEAYRPHPGHFYDEGPYDGPYYYPANYSGDPREICAQNFRSFDWRTGYFTTYSGERRLCPYLRDAGPRPEGPPPPRAPY